MLPDSIPHAYISVETGRQTHHREACRRKDRKETAIIRASSSELQQPRLQTVNSYHKLVVKRSLTPRAFAASDCNELAGRHVCP